MVAFGMRTYCERRLKHDGRVSSFRLQQHIPLQVRVFRQDQLSSHLSILDGRKPRLPRQWNTSCFESEANSALTPVPSASEARMLIATLTYILVGLDTRQVQARAVDLLAATSSLLNPSRITPTSTLL